MDKVINVNNNNSHVELTDEQKKQAAYALNLCLVSISQIIDYSDVIVLEQEYDGILNNLNLENMPKDDVLLEVLRQILDTITFFKIQEVEKEFIEQNYKNKVKSAIWKALPNPQAIFASGHWIAMLVVLVGQVGTGYMNYRNAKAEANSEFEKEKWALQKAAIEQFAGLRRELFTTAWKLADRYNFSDSLRLTESQITQYNKVLTDPNLNRKLLRLEDLEECFGAYPPFWYNKGHTALALSESFDVDYANDMRAIAKEAFEKYFEINVNGKELLRTDPVCATTALEYITLLPDNAIDAKVEYIKRAVANAGNHFDILQMCAMAFLSVDKIDDASKILRKLACEGYNEDMNSQLLSAIYVEAYLSDRHNKQIPEKNYKLLCGVTNETALIPWPETVNVTLQDLYSSFIDKRRDSLMETYANFMVHYYDQKSSECRIISGCDQSVREQNFIRFIKNIINDLRGFPCTNIEYDEFIKALSEHKNIMRDIIMNGKCTNKIFDSIFGDIFIVCSKNISEIQLVTMDDITNLEIELSNAISNYTKQTEHFKNVDYFEEDTLHSFLELPDNTTEQFKDIKNKIKNRVLLRSDAKHTHILLYGEQEFYRYVKNSGLDENHIVAVINDKSARDCDLLITETGLIVRDFQSQFTNGAKTLIFTPGAIKAIETRSIMLKEILFSDVTYKEDKLKNPNYKNKDINMDELFALIEDIKRDCNDDSIEFKIHNTIISKNNVLNFDLFE